jgi:hypothetical protein
LWEYFGGIMLKTLVGVFALLLLAVFNAHSQGKSSLSLFMGHYGYSISYPGGYDVKPKFGRSEDGTADEIVNFIPAACVKVSRQQCGNLGMIKLAVTPKLHNFKIMGAKNLREVVSLIAGRAKDDGEAPGKPFAASLGGLPGYTFIKSTPAKDSFTAITVIEGKKVLYLFEYQHRVKSIGRILKSLSEIKPHDNPPD